MEEEEMDISFFIEEAKEENLYNKFYKSKVKSIYISFIFIKDFNIINIHRFKHHLNTPGLLSRHEFTLIYKNHRLYKEEIFSLFGLALFNYNLSNKDIFENKEKCGFKIIDSIGDIWFEETISFFNDLNELFIILKPKQIVSLTKKIRLSNPKKTKKRLYF